MNYFERLLIIEVRIDSLFMRFWFDFIIFISIYFGSWFYSFSKAYTRRKADAGSPSIDCVTHAFAKIYLLKQ